jgi:hypothetical protein
MITAEAVKRLRNKGTLCRLRHELTTGIKEGKIEEQKTG